MWGSMQGADKTINTKVGLDLPMSEQVRQWQVTLNEELWLEQCLVSDQVHGMFTFKIFILTKAEQAVGSKHLKKNYVCKFSE